MEGDNISAVLAAAVTHELIDAVTAFVAATDQNGAFAPRALRRLVESEPDRLTPESLSAAISVANATANWRAGGSAAWPNGPASIESGEPKEVLKGLTSSILDAVAAAGGPARRSAYDAIHWTVYAFGGGRSRVALMVPWLPHPNDHQASVYNQYAVVAYLISDDGSPRDETWGYRIESIRELRSRRTDDE